ncbi:Glycine betaine transport system permease protein OpuAB [Sulfitobacter noctilucicola]|uniref:Glycine betaine/proline transport system permease protein n=1 Tax=Sulfitobacter noctilucicola TaxID=1342301 RepID=A0A7W6Q4D5_9RHOB|nr:Glycine betaine transport system permease protein OpuAB [Sulfitobacter noctilucicola]MBB4175145.1 glycine betaine/proline transport system permease protein [Sulfitobacter noctilucicola]
MQLLLALPTMAVGFNQAIMFALTMVIIAAFIGTQDLGQELQHTLAGTDLGKNFALGICVSLTALTFDLNDYEVGGGQKADAWAGVGFG